MSIVVALLLMSQMPSEAVHLQLKNQKSSLGSQTKDPSAVNPDFESSMTLLDWKNFTPEETLDMYQKADYNVAKAQKQIEENKNDIDDLNETLNNAQDQIDEVDKQISKLQLKWDEYQTAQKAEIKKAAKQAKLLEEGQAAIKKVEKQEAAEKASQEAEDSMADEEAKATFEEEASAAQEKAVKNKADQETDDSDESSILDAVNTDNLSDEITPEDIASAASVVEEKEGPSATIDSDAIESEDPVESAMTEVEEEEESPPSPLQQGPAGPAGPAALGGGGPAGMAQMMNVRSPPQLSQLRRQEMAKQLAQAQQRSLH